jgi:hypothetical protein
MYVKVFNTVYFIGSFLFQNMYDFCYFVLFGFSFCLRQCLTNLAWNLLCSLGWPTIPVLLPQLPECCNYRHVPPLPADVLFLNLQEIFSKLEVFWGTGYCYSKFANTWKNLGFHLLHIVVLQCLNCSTLVVMGPFGALKFGKKSMDCHGVCWL